MPNEPRNTPPNRRLLIGIVVFLVVMIAVRLLPIPIPAPATTKIPLDTPSQPKSNETAPMIAPANAPTVVPTTETLELGPISLVSESPCTAPLVETTIGSTKHPIARKYAHLGHLGSFFTAYECGPERLKATYGDQPTYDAGVSITLGKDPSVSLRTLLKDIGFQCASGKAESRCRSWSIDIPVERTKLYLLKDHTYEIVSDDCINCG